MSSHLFHQTFSISSFWAFCWAFWCNDTRTHARTHTHAHTHTLAHTHTHTHTHTLLPRGELRDKFAGSVAQQLKRGPQKPVHASVMIHCHDISSFCHHNSCKSTWEECVCSAVCERNWQKNACTICGIKGNLVMKQFDSIWNNLIRWWIFISLGKSIQTYAGKRVK